ncbi:MAG: hypothetical protein RL757_1085 [Bacteroidota bacterium]
MTEEQIFEILDEIADAETLQLHQQLYKTDANYQKKFNHFQKLQQQLADLPLESPSMRFTQNVMESVLPQRAPQKADKVGIGFAMAAGILIFLTIVWTVANVNQTILPKEMTQTMDNYQSLTNHFMQSNVLKTLLFLFGLIALRFFDVAILKPYFLKRKNEFSV